MDWVISDCNVIRTEEPSNKNIPDRIRKYFESFKDAGDKGPKRPIDVMFYQYNTTEKPVVEKVTSFHHVESERYDC